MNIAGGTHHAFYDRGEAFCMLNDQAIAANYLIEKGLSKRILIIDLDVHQGNGTASLFRSNNNVFTLSFHGKKNYPFRKEKSDLDIEFDDNTNDDSSVVQHAYSDSGLFSPSLTVSDGYLFHTVTKTEMITISGGGGE